MKVFELCNRAVATIDARDTVVMAAKRMRESHVGDLVAVERSDGGVRAVGILTDRDLVVSAIAAEIDPSTLEVRDVMRSDLVTATEDEDVDVVLRRMRKFAVRRVPVIDAAGLLYGILAIDDVLSWLRDDLAEVVSIAPRQRREEWRHRD
ncbi:MAG: CBS domain-containing protein [Polyangiales bacterium]